MAIKSSKDLNKSKMKIDLRGPEGNAYMLLGIARNLARQLSKDWDPIRTKMTSGDYENLIKVFDKEFGDYADLYR